MEGGDLKVFFVLFVSKLFVNLLPFLESFHLIRLFPFFNLIHPISYSFRQTGLSLSSQQVAFLFTFAEFLRRRSVGFRNVTTAEGALWGERLFGICFLDNLLTLDPV